MQDVTMRFARIRKRVDSSLIDLQRQVLVDAFETHVRHNGLLTDGDRLLDHTLGNYLSIVAAGEDTIPPRSWRQARGKATRVLVACSSEMVIFIGWGTDPMLAVPFEDLVSVSSERHRVLSFIFTDVDGREVVVRFKTFPFGAKVFLGAVRRQWRRRIGASDAVDGNPSAAT